MDDDTDSGSESSFGDTDEAGDDTNLSSHNDDSESSDVASEEVVDIVNVSDDGTTAEGGGGGSEKSVEMEEQESRLTETEIEEQKDVSMKESAKPESSSAATATLENQESSESYGEEETEPRVLQNFPLKSMEIEERNLRKDVPMKESTKPESSSAAAAAEDQESSELDGDEETEPVVFRNLPPNFPTRFTTLIEDPESIRPRILIEKRLRQANVDLTRDRLSISAKKMKETFLVPDEETMLKSGNVMEVNVIEPEGRAVSSLTLRRRRLWRKTYELIDGWNYVVARNINALKAGELVRVWYFRVKGELWFALEVLGEEQKDSEISKHLVDKWYGQKVFFP